MSPDSGASLSELPAVRKVKRLLYFQLFKGIQQERRYDFMYIRNFRLKYLLCLLTLERLPFYVF